jgi:hypothetical protein
VRFKIYSLSRSIDNCWMFNLRPGGALGWKVEVCRLGRSGSVMWRARTYKVVPPPLSVKDQWVGPREQVWNVLIAYW